MALTLLDKKSTGLVVVDMQEGLMKVMARRAEVLDQTVKLLHLVRVFSLPVIVTEQYPQRIGQTVPMLRELLPAYAPVAKVEFNSCEVALFNERLAAAQLTDLILVGVEAHICVFQTCVALLKRGYRVHVPQDAVASRAEDNRRVGLDLMKEAGAVISSAECLIFQILKKAGTPEFKQLITVIK